MSLTITVRIRWMTPNHLLNKRVTEFNPFTVDEVYSSRLNNSERPLHNECDLRR